MIQMIQDLMTLISLGLTIPAVIICMGVIKLWHHQYVNYCTTKNRTPSLFLIAGVYISFCGSLVDNTWWGVAWTLDYLSHPYTDWWFENGVYSNVFFRQTALIYAGILHIHAENMSRDEPSRTQSLKLSKNIILGGMSLGCLFMVILLSLKYSLF